MSDLRRPNLRQLEDYDSMDTSITVAAISASAAIVVPAISFYLTKSKEREADWRKYKFEHYRDFITALAGIVGSDATLEGHRRFATTCNTLHLLASRSVLKALHEFQDEIRISNQIRSEARHDVLLSKLVWEIRNDLSIPRTSDVSGFTARLWCSGTNPDIQSRSQ